MNIDELSKSIDRVSILVQPVPKFAHCRDNVAFYLATCYTKRIIFI